MSPMQQMLLGTSPGGDTYWIKSDGKDTSGYKMQYDGIYVDTAGNVYIYGQTNEPWNSSYEWARNHMLLNKYDKHGTNIFYKRYSNGVYNQGHEDTMDGLQVYSDGSFILANKSGMGQASMVKVTTSGSVSWKKRYGTDDSYGIQGNISGVAVNSSDQAMFFGGGASGNSGNIDLIQLNSSGSLVKDWAVATTSSGNYGTGFTRMKYDSSGNLYVVGTRGQSGTYDKDGLIMKFNSSMAIQWQHTLGNSGYYPIDTYEDLAFDSSSNVYMCGSTRDGNSRTWGWIVKYNSSGTLQWQKKFGNSSGPNINLRSIDIDGDDNVYVQGEADTYGKQPIWAKLNTSGVVQYKRSLRELYSNNSSADWMRMMKVFGDALYIVGRRYTGSVRHYGWIAKLPKEGIATGTYCSKYEIAEPNLSISNTSYTEDRVAVNFTISEITNKNIFNGSMNVNTPSWPEDIYSCYDLLG